MNPIMYTRGREAIIEGETVRTQACEPPGSLAAVLAGNSQLLLAEVYALRRQCIKLRQALEVVRLEIGVGISEGGLAQCVADDFRRETGFEPPLIDDSRDTALHQAVWDAWNEKKREILHKTILTALERDER